MMNRYDNYSPEIYELEDEISSPQAEQSLPLPEFKNNKGKSVKHGRKVVSEKKNERNGKTQKREREAGASFSFVQWCKSVANQTTLRMLTGIFLCCFAAYLGVSFVSYLSTCIADQSEISHSLTGQAIGIKNAGGEAGARLSDILINDTFGLGSIVLLVWLVAMSLKLLVGYPKFKSVNFTIKCLVALITVSLLVGLATISVNSPINWGGHHGLEINRFIIRFIGWTGAAILGVFMICCFVAICLRDVINWLIRIKKERTEKIRLAREAQEKELDRQAVLANDLEKEQLDEQACTDPDIADCGIEEDDSLVSFEDGGDRDLVNDDIDSYVYEPLEDDRDIIEKQNESINNTAAQDLHGFDEDLDKGSDIDRVNDNLNSGDKEDSEKAPEDAMIVNRNTIEQSGQSRLSGESGPKYKLPPFDLLREGSAKIPIDPQELNDNKEQIRQTLLDFKIPIQSIEATVGPTVTLYEIVPGTGVKISRICSLADDIALNLSATGVRIIAPIPGRGTVGIEVANKERHIVAMRSVLQSRKFAESKYKLPIALGATISNDVYIADLAKMPHLLVAGATGQGKSVCLNAIITSLVYRKRPDELKFVMIDPKRVEFSLYNKFESHYLAKLPDANEAIITKKENVVPTLSSLCVEMENRYELLQEAHCRNLEEYNTKIKERRLNPEKGHRFLPYMVIIVDEFGDLVMTEGKAVELPIALLAQKARAVGMHVIIATQRPSVKVITGLIKANFPARFAFRTTSGVDSKTILDTVGAEQLIGMGDMLVNHNSEMVRVQCAFIDTPEVEALCDYVERQPFNAGAYILPDPVIQGNSEGGIAESGFSEYDPMLAECAQAIMNSNVASTSSLQRRFSIGYNRAGKIMDQLETLGIVGPAHGGKPRTILVDPNAMETILKSL